MLEQEGQPAEAVAVYREALRHAPPPALTARLRAQLLAAAGRDEAAVKAFRRALRLDPREKTSYYGLHEALGRLSRYEEQLENLVFVLREIDPNDLFALTQVYTPCARLRRFDQALPLLERAVAVDPHSPLALKWLFQTRMNLRRLDAQTGKLAQRLVEIAPQLVDSWSQLSWYYAELGRAEDSLAVLRHLVGEHPNNAEAHAALAWRYHYLGRPEAELSHARRAYELEPQNRHVCWTLLTACTAALARTLDDAEVRQYAAEIAARFPTDAAVMVWLSRMYGAHRREVEALAAARRAVALNPTWIEAQAQLAAVQAFRRSGVQAFG
jgi:tetratricopeptide (TPR) repeat protein